MKIDFRIFEEVPVASYEKYSILLEGEEGKHKKPHIHLKEKGNRLASIAIEDGEVLAGKLPRDFRACLLAWLERYRTDLMEDWKGMQLQRRPHEYDLGPC